MSKVLPFLQQVPIFSGLDQASLQQLSARARTLRLRKGVELLTEGETGESLYLIISGRVKIFVSDEQGNEMSLFIEGPGNYIGEISLLDDEPRTASAVTLEPCEVISVSKKDFTTVIEHNPSVAFAVISELTKKLRRATETTRSLALRNVYQRLALKLLELAEEGGDGRSVITPKYSNGELGKMIGASREMVGKVMVELIRGEYIEVVDNTLVLLKEFPSNW